jgi:predicted secreted hydrolase
VIARTTLLLLLLVAAAAAEKPTFLHARADFPWEFPRDHWAHPEYRSEWWYFTGHLEAEGPSGPRRFGYQVTFFRVGLLPDAPTGSSRWLTRGLVMGHLALSDLSRQEHHFREVLRRETSVLGGFPAPNTGDPRLAWVQGPAGTDARWVLRWEDGGFAFEAADDAAGVGLALRAAPGKPRIFQGPGGLSKKTDQGDSASLYYSYTRLETTGTLRLGDEELVVRGESWMDKEFGSSKLAADQVGWDWFSLQLADGRELMIYLLRRKDGSVSHARGTLVDREGAESYLGPEAWKVRTTRTWTSPASGGAYPVAWTLALPAHGLDLVIEGAFDAQENVSTLIPGMAYWEGAVDVRDAEGEPAGRGFVELTGYAGDGAGLASLR